MANGIANVSYNKELESYALEGEASSTVSAIKKSVEAGAGVGVEPFDAEAFGVQLSYGYENTSSSHYHETSNTIGSRLIWRHGLGRRHYFELGPQGRYGKTEESETEDGKTESENYKNMVSGVFARYRLGWLTLRGAGDMLFRKESGEYSRNSLKTKFQASGEWEIRDIPILSILNFIRVEDLNLAVEYTNRRRFPKHVKNKKESGASGSVGLSWQLGRKVKLTASVGVTKDPEAENVALTTAIQLSLTSGGFAGSASLNVDNGYFPENRGSNY